MEVSEISSTLPTMTRADVNLEISDTVREFIVGAAECGICFISLMTTLRDEEDDDLGRKLITEGVESFGGGFVTATFDDLGAIVEIPSLDTFSNC